MINSADSAEVAEAAVDTDDWHAIIPVPEGVPLVVPQHRFGTPDTVWDYRDSDGRLLGRVARWNRPEGKKEILPITYGSCFGREPEWRFKAMPIPRPLYGLDRLAARPDATVLVVEGEKKIAPGAGLFPDCVVLTSAGGSKAADMSDWSPVSGRAVVIWPDQDAPGAAYADAVARLALNAGAASVRIVSVPPQFPARWDLADELPVGVAADELGRLLAEAKPFVVAEEGPDLGVLRQGRRPPPDLPLDVFGPEWARWIVEAAEGAGSPKDYVAGALLASTAALIGNTRTVEAWPGWREPSVLWVAAVGDPSSNKSPGADMVLDGVRRIEKYLAEDFERKHRTWEREALAARAAKAAWEKKVTEAAAKGGPANLLCPDDPAPEPVRPRVMINDTTPEAMGNLLARNPRGVLQFRDELSGWIKSFDRYSNASGRAMWTEAYGARPFVIDRVKHPEPIHILRLTVSVLGNIQPDRFAEVLRDADDGLAARVLWMWPEALPPIRPSTAASTSFLDTALRRIADLKPADGPPEACNPVVLQLVPEAADTFHNWRLEHHRTLDGGGGLLASAFGKLSGTVLRLALVFEHLWWAAEGGPSPVAVSEAAVLAGMTLVDDYVKPMADRVYGDAALPQSERNAATLARHLRRERLDAINPREIQRRKLHGLRTADAVKAAIDVLVEARILLDETRSRAGDGPGREKVTYRVNPLLYEGASQ